MRVVDVNEFYSPTGGGVRTYIDHKMTIMAELGHELIVIAPAKENAVEERPGGGRIHWVKAPTLILDPNYGIFVRGGAIHQLLDELHPDVVEASSPWRPATIVADWPGHAVKVYFAHNDNVGAYPMRWFERMASRERIEEAGEVEGYWPGAPDLAVEVVSPNDSYASVEEKVAAWLEAGTHVVVVVEPRTKTVTVRSSRTEIRIFTEGDVLDVGDAVPGWTIPVDDIFG